MAEITGIDVSKYQGNIDWQKVKAAGIRFVIMRAAGHGIYGFYTDACLEQNYQGATEQQIPLGFYYVVYPGINPATQMNYFLSAIAGKFHQLPLFLDVELNGGYPTASADPYHRVHACVSACVTLLDDTHECLIYTNQSFGNTYLLGDCGRELWDASYTTASKPALPRWWTTYRIWQYSSHGKVNGIYGDVDLNRFNGSEIDFAAWTGLPVPVLPPTIEERVASLEARVLVLEQGEGEIPY